MFWLLFVFIFIISTISTDLDSIEIEIDSTGRQSSTSSPPQSKNETFGQKLLRSQAKRYSYIYPGQTQSDAVGARVKNPNNEAYDMYWYNHNNGDKVYNGRMKPKGVKSTNSYIRHTFFLTKITGNKEEIYRFTIQPNVNMYLIPLDNQTGDIELYKKLKEEIDFNAKYLKDHGRPWVTNYPRDKPILPIWSANYIGQIHHVKSNAYFWKCIPINDSLEEKKKCQENKEITLNIECVSMYPKIFVIENSISDIEADLIVNLSKPKIKRSLAGNDGGLVTDTRTSMNAWLDRHEHYILDTIYRRAGDILNISETLLWSDKNMENLQVVHYDVNQEYAPHHDFGADGRNESRFLTLLYYLNDQASEFAGGETTFPKANNGKGLAIHPGKGNSVLFYSLLEDGNGDDLSLHSGSKVRQGDKWVANFWVWDPHR